MISLPQIIPGYNEANSLLNEPIILCDESGIATGVIEKLVAHSATTPRHLAFSCYVFNERGELLVTQRANSKKVWPGVWTNSVCGHPAPGETFEQAIARRLKQELGMTITNITVQLPNYKYTTPAFNGIIENEVCPVFFAKATSEPNPNPVEVEAYKWLSWKDYGQELQQDKGNVYSWWSKDQYKRFNDSSILPR
jgi:isopentenyl-diphosphate delta-isomerase